jgi:hypothetical protein
MKNNDALKKHHFWILLGFVPLFVLIAVMMISSGVGGAITKEDAAIDQAKKSIGSKTSPKPNALIEKMDKTIQQVDGKQEDLWRSNWDRQKTMFAWPNSPRLKGSFDERSAAGSGISNSKWFPRTASRSSVVG